MAAAATTAPIVCMGVPTLSQVSNTSTVDGPSVTGARMLFAGKKFWVSAQVPQRNYFVELVLANGGSIVKLEAQADIRLVDHMKPNPAPNTTSFRYVELSVQHGRLEKLEDHVAAGPVRAYRPPGSTVVAPRSGRNAYTKADEQFLWNWVQPLREAGGSDRGNMIFHELERVNSRHTWQSWRDHWVKFTSLRKDMEVTERVYGEVDEEELLERRRGRGRGILEERVGRVKEEAEQEQNRKEERQADGKGEKEVEEQQQQQQEEEEEEEEEQEEQEKQETDKVDEEIVGILNGDNDSRRNAKSRHMEERTRTVPEEADSEAMLPERHNNPFTRKEEKMLFDAAEYIVDTLEENLDEAWQKMSEGFPTHTAKEWRAFFESTILPIYEENLRNRRRKPEMKTQREPTLSPEPSLSEVVGEIAQADKNIQLHPKSPTQQHNPLFLPESLSKTNGVSQDGGRVPEPNEARKRTARRGTDSQESNQSSFQGLDGAREREHTESPRKRKRDADSDFEAELEVNETQQQGSPELPLNMTVQPIKRSKYLLHEPNTLEIASTPEHEIRGKEGRFVEEEVEHDPASPTPRAQKSPQRQITSTLAPFSPLFVAEDSLPSTPRAQINPALDEENEQTSPLSVQLFSDRPTAPSQPSDPPEPDLESFDLEFETAADVSQIFETARSHNTPGSTAAARLETQALLSESMPTDFDTSILEFPRPDGEDDGPESAPSNDEQSSSHTSPTVEEWVQSHLSRDPNSNQISLLDALTRTNLDFDLADIVYASMVAGRGVPKNMQGVWTKEDDEVLQGQDARAIDALELKHGEGEVVERLGWLEGGLK